MERIYYIRKDHKILTASTKAGAFEAYDSFGRHDVTIMERIRENGWEYVSIGHKMTRRTLKSGEISYRIHFDNIYRKDA